MLVEEGEQGGQVDHVALAVHIESHIFGGAQVDVGSSDFFHRLTGEGDVELALGLL